MSLRRRCWEKKGEFLLLILDWNLLLLSDLATWSLLDWQRLDNSATCRGHFVSIRKKITARGSLVSTADTTDFEAQTDKKLQACNQC
jgi:hypothetical protein